MAQILAGKRIDPTTDLLISPGSKQVLKMLAAEGLIDPLLDAGARLLLRGFCEEVLRDLPPAAAVWHPLQTPAGPEAPAR